MSEPEVPQAKETLGEKVGVWALIFLFIPTFLGLFDGITTLAVQLLGWLKTGQWTPQTAWEGLQKWGFTDRPSVDWVVPNNVLNWVLDGPRWLWLPILGCIYLGVVLWIVISIMTLIENRWPDAPKSD